VDPISLIVTALISGASAAAQETAGNVVKDAYAGLRRLISERFGRGKEPKELEAPEENRPALTEQLKRIGADGDEDLVRAAQEVMKQTDPEGARAGIYNVTISGGKGIVVGSYSNVTMNFEGD
jgi:hypothetical protein